MPHIKSARNGTYSRPPEKGGEQRLKPRLYDEPVVRGLIKLWELLNYSCGKRLAAIMPELVAKLECLHDRGNVAGT